METGSTTASDAYAATVRVRRRDFEIRRDKLESIIRSKPSADPAAAWCCCERRIFRASHRHVWRIMRARRRRLFAAEPFADATRAVRWRLMSRQALHFTRRRKNRQRRKSWFGGGFALRHALFQLVAVCGFVACHAWRFVAFDMKRLPVKSICMPNHPGDALFPLKPFRTHVAQTTRHACVPADYFEMVSSAMPFVRGPMNPIAIITITIAPAMNANTPNVPKPFSTAAITNDEKIAEKRLHE